MPGPLGRPTEPADYVKDALVARILMEVREHEHNSVRDEYLENALKALVEIMKIEGVDVEEYFSGEEIKIAAQNALSELVISGAMFTKTRNDGRHYFESFFIQRAQRMVQENLSEEMRVAAQKAMDDVMQVLIWGNSWRARVDMYKARKAAAEAVVPSA